MGVFAFLHLGCFFIDVPLNNSFFFDAALNWAELPKALHPIHRSECEFILSK